MFTVVGDVLVDKYWNGRPCGENPEVHGGLKIRIESEGRRLGGAGAVAALVAAQGLPVCLWSVVGSDAEGTWVHDECSRLSITDEIWPDRSRSTPVKCRVVYGGRIQGDRLDWEDPHWGSLPEYAMKCWSFGKLDGPVIVQDYGKGTCGPSLLRMVFDRAAQARLPALVDPAYGRPWDVYEGATLIKANLREARWALARATGTGQEWNALACADALARRYRVNVVVTAGAAGMAWACHEGRSGWVDAQYTEAVDITGAGDTVLAALAIHYYEPLPDACRLAAAAAAEQVRHLGVAIVSIPARSLPEHPDRRHRGADQLRQPEAAASLGSEP